MLLYINMFSFISCSKLIGKSYNMIPKTITSSIKNKYVFNNIIKNKHNEHFSDEEYELYLVNNNKQLNDKKLLSISPGGFKGFYQFGILSYIKKNYNLDNFIFTGASAGAWNCLFMSFKPDTRLLKKEMFGSNIINSKSLYDLQYNLKDMILTKFSDDDFELDKLFLGVTTFRNFEIKTNIYTDFDDLEDAIDCCIASSHIPFITGTMINKYHDRYSFDGGFSSYPYLNITRPVLHITPDLWDNAYTNKKGIINNNYDERNKAFKEIVYGRKFNLLELYYKGYEDSKLHKEYLDTIFINE